LRTRVLLGAMMFFQYAAWGAWAPVLGATLGSPDGIFKAPGAAIGAIFGILWLACIVVPFVGGQLVTARFLVNSSWAWQESFVLVLHM